jgi:hypothetical protein
MVFVWSGIRFDAADRTMEPAMPSAPSVFDSECLAIPCPGCGQKHPRSIAWIKANSRIDCPCGTIVKLDKTEFVHKVREVERALAALPRTVTLKL